MSFQQHQANLHSLNFDYQEHEKTLDDLQDQLVQAQEQEKTLREDLKDGELKIKELEGEGMTLTGELQQMKTLTEELEQTQMKSSKEIETLTGELQLSKTESHEKLETLKNRLLYCP